MSQRLFNQACALEGRFRHLDDANRVMVPFLAEIASAAFLRLLGIGTAPSVMIVNSAEASTLGRNWIIKGADGKSRWHQVPYKDLDVTTFVLAVGKIPGAVTLRYLRERYGIAQSVHAGPLVFVEPGRVLFEGKACPEADQLYAADFTPPADWSAIRSAIEWDSEPMLRIHAARFFLAATTAHASNLLIDGNAKLYSIDHSDLALTDSSELNLLFDNVSRDSKAWDALCLIGSLDIRELRFFGPAYEHYAKRLNRWKRCLSS